MYKHYNVGQEFAPGDAVELDVSALASDGRGLGRLASSDPTATENTGSPVVFVDDALPGQRVRVVLERVRSRMLEGRVDAVLAASPDERAALCGHAAHCGGCPWQGLQYEAQLRWKTQVLDDALRRVGKIEASLLPILPSPNEWGYRNKMSFVFGQGEGQDLVLGLRGRRSHTVTDITACRMQSPETMAVLDAVRALVRANVGGAGDCWRYAVVRQPRAGGLGLELIVGPQGRTLAGATLCAELRDAVPALTHFALSLRMTHTDAAMGEKTLFAWGNKLEERLERPDGSLLRLGFDHRAFLQVNTSAAEMLYAEALRLLAPRGDERLWDIYGGVGSIGLFMAPFVADVCGLESVGVATTMARANAVGNGLSARFETGDAVLLKSSARLKKMFGAFSGPQLVVVDPPRAGLDKAVIEGLISLNPEKILYISCNPSTLARDAAILIHTHTLEAVRPVDLFPQTPHIESVSLWIRRG